MAFPLEQFVKHLADSGVLPAETLREFVPPKASPKDAEDLARELVRRQKLTKFQAELLWQGKGKSLVLGNYVLMEKIGAGGMGQVFKARHRVMERLVAVKVLPVAMTTNREAIARFHREVKAAAKLRHLNIIAADDADQENGVHFLVMEFVDGSDLSALVKKNGPLPVDKAVNYILQAARGLEYAHAEGIVHRDIKPANLLLDRKGTVKILDMGLARIHGDVAQAELTATGAVMGTVDYMAPEQALSTKTADARADIYSLGCSLYYLLTGKPTYDGETLMAKLIAHRDQTIPDLRTVCPHVPETVDAIFKKMVAKKVEDRYQTMTDVIAALERCGGGQSVNAPSFAASDTGLANFLQGIAVTPETPVYTKKVAIKKKSVAGPPIGKDKKRLVKIGGGVLGVLILLAGIVMCFTSNGGAPVVTVDHVVEKEAVTSKPVAAERSATETAKSTPMGSNSADALQGNWIGVREEVNGEPSPAITEKRFIFADRKMIMTRLRNGVPGKYEGTFEVDVPARQFDFAGVAPGGTPVIWKGIYKRDGDSLTLCYKYVKNGDTTRPTEFKTDDKAGTVFVLIDLRLDPVNVHVPSSSPEVPKPIANLDDPAFRRKPPGREKVRIDLLKLVDPKQSFNGGEWKIGPAGLFSPDEHFMWALIKVPYEVPAEYDWDAKVERVSNEGMALTLQFTTSGHRGAVCIDGYSRAMCALEMIDGKNGPTFQGPVLMPGKPSTIRVSVRTDSIAVVCDGKEILTWKGDMAKFSPYPKWAVPDNQNLFVGSQASFIIHEMNLTPIVAEK